jgi:CheY-like chemotaxis protein
MSQQRKARILCVEDEQDIRDNISEILRDEGFEVFEAYNGKSGYESFLKNKPDLIISDVMMPDVDGYGLLKLVRENNTTRCQNVPFIFLTALGQKHDIVKGVNMLANDYLIKPIDFDLMIAKIKEKLVNFFNLEGQYDKNVKNIKSQVSLVLSQDLLNYLKIITNTAAILKDEPYGPLPHRKYFQDFEKIYDNAIKLRAAIDNSLDEKVIDYKLNANEEVFDVKLLLSDLISTLNQKYRDKIIIETGFDDEKLPRVKIDKLIISEALKKILSFIFKVDVACNIKIRIMIDHLDQMILVFAISSDLGDIGSSVKIDESPINSILSQQNCNFEVVDNQENTMILVIPSYRIINS